MNASRLTFSKTYMHREYNFRKLKLVCLDRSMGYVVKVAGAYSRRNKQGSDHEFTVMKIQ